MTIGLDLTLRNVRLQNIIDAIDTDGDEYGAGLLRIYSGDRPVTGGELDEYDVLLVEFALPLPCGTINNGVLTFGAVVSVEALADGTASWARIVDTDENFVMDLSVTNEAGSGDVKINDVIILDGIFVEFISATITEGNA